MATTLTKPVVRKANSTMFDRGTRNIIFSLEPGTHGHPDVVGVRLAGTRRTYRANLGTVAQFVMEADIDAARRRIERRAKELNKSQGMPLRTARRLAREEQKSS